MINPDGPTTAQVIVERSFPTRAAAEVWAAQVQVALQMMVRKPEATETHYWTATS